MNEARGQFADFFGRLWREKPLGIASGIVILILILLAIFADALAPYPVDQLNLAERLQGSSTRHLLGTDQLGRDQLSRLLVGARISLVVGLAATTLNVVVATLIGATSGFLGGKLDLAVQRFVDAWMAVPGAAAVARSCRSRGRVCHRSSWCWDRRRRGRLARGQRRGGGHQGERFFSGRPGGRRADATGPGAPRPAQHRGAADHRLQHQRRRRHPGRGELELSRVRAARQCPELGRDAQPGGAAVHGAGAWLALWPGLCLTIVVYSFNMLGDAMRDLLDPRLRGGGVWLPAAPRRSKRAIKEQEASATHPLRLPSRDVPQVGLARDVLRSITAGNRPARGRDRNRPCSSR